MTERDEQGRPEPPLAADETATLLGFLDYQRATLGWKCAGLDSAGLRATVGASSMTLGGMLKHPGLTSRTTGSPGGCTGETGSPRGTRWTGRPTPTGNGNSAADDSHEELHALWQDTVARSRSLVAEASRHADLLRESVDGLTGE